MTEDEAMKMMEEFDKQFEEEVKATELLDFLEIPNKNYQVHISDLYKIFSDPEKCQQLISKLKLKAFL